MNRSMWVSVGLLGTAVLTSSASGQVQPSADELLRNFEQSAEEFGAPDRSDVSITIMFHERYPAARVDSILNGLQRLGATAPGRRTRQLATVWLLIAGQGRDAPGLTGVVGRLAEIYSSSPSTHRLILLGMPQQAETADAISFLADVAAEGTGTEPLMALQGLRSIGPQGEAVLRALHATGAVADASARAALARMAERGFVPDP